MSNSNLYGRAGFRLVADSFGVSCANSLISTLYSGDNKLLPSLCLDNGEFLTFPLRAISIDKSKDLISVLPHFVRFKGDKILYFDNLGNLIGMKLSEGIFDKKFKTEGKEIIDSGLEQVCHEAYKVKIFQGSPSEWKGSEVLSSLGNFSSKYYGTSGAKMKQFKLDCYALGADAVFDFGSRRNWVSSNLSGELYKIDKPSSY